VHTHLDEESLTQDDFLDLIFLRLDAIAAIQVDQNGGARDLEVAHVFPGNGDGAAGWQVLPPIPCYDPDLDFLDLVQSLEKELDRTRSAIPSDEKKDRAILVSVAGSDMTAAKDSMAELVELATSSGIVVVDAIIQRPREINRKYLIGKGKLGEIIIRALQHGVDLLIFDQELNPSQIRSITDITELRVIDRTQLILDIFAQRAQSREGKIQVEMAQLKYLTGGIGARGPGETKLEINRRRTKDRITQLENELKVVRKNRALRRSKRVRKEVPIISIVGYTNAGKSTLMNTLTHSQVFAGNQLFATLDPTSRRLRFPRDFEVIITDTVGFIRDLPKDLIESFAATLEELYDADMLLHVVDISNPLFEEQMAAVDRILTQLELNAKPTVLVFNKADLVDPGYTANQLNRYGGVAVSALSTATIESLILALQDRVEALMAEGLIPTLEETVGPGEA
jgi:GTP-binding protein HflX